jgi:hypothetical protein
MVFSSVMPDLIRHPDREEDFDRPVRLLGRHSGLDPEFVSERYASGCDSELIANTPTEGLKTRRVWPRREKSSGVMLCIIIFSISPNLLSLDRRGLR